MIRRARFKTDENLPAEAAGVLRSGGYDAATVLEQEMGGDPDDSLAEACRREGRVLVTLDTDFADLRAYPPHAHSGFVVLRLSRQDKAHVAGVLQRLLPLFASEPTEGRLWIVDERQVRIRGGEGAPFL